MTTISYTDRQLDTFGLRSNPSNKNRISGVNVNYHQKSIKSLDSDFKQQEWDGSVISRRMELIENNLKFLCPYTTKYTGAPSTIVLPSKTNGYWYQSGNMIGFQVEADMTWFIMNMKT